MANRTPVHAVEEPGRVDESRSLSPWRILCEVDAKWLDMVVPHWLFFVEC